MQTKRQEIFIDILGISVVFGNMETMGTESYIQSQLEQGSSVTACTWNDNGTIKFAYSDRLDISVLAHEIEQRSYYRNPYIRHFSPSHHQLVICHNTTYHRPATWNNQFRPQC